jgi:hypothetical protein
MNPVKTSLRDEVNKLAEQAFHQRLISGYGNGEYADQYQIVYQGKPRSFPLEQAHFSLMILLDSLDNDSYSVSEISRQ